MTAVRRLTAEGSARFRDWIDQGGRGPARLHLLTDAETSEPVGSGVSLALREFSTRLEMGQYLVEQLVALPASVVQFEVGLWDWITLFYIDVIAPQRAGGSRDMREPARYYLELKNRKWSRHLVRMNWMGVAEHGQAARAMLAVGLNKQSDVLEQMAGQQELFGDKTVIKVVDRLYWDTRNGAAKRGAQSKGGGTPRRLRRFMRQFRRTYDPPAMTPDELLASLPEEFDRWKPATPFAKAGVLAEALA